MAALKTFLLSHMKDMAQLEECSGRSDEGDTAEKDLFSALHVLLVLMLNSQFTEKYKKHIFSLNSSGV